mgnify:CR=1 FL=1
MGFIGVQPASVPLTASDITNDIVNADKIADNSISEEHLDPTVITGLSALGAEPADTDEFIISDAGTLKRMDYSYIKSSGGGLVYVGGGSTTSDVSNITIDNVFTSTYKNYLLVGEATSDGGGSDFRFQFRSGGSSGSTLSGGEYNYHFIRYNADSDSTNNHRSQSNTACIPAAAVDTDVTRVGYRFSWTCFDPFTSSRRTTVSGTGRGTATDANSFFSSGSCDYKGSDSVTGMIFYFSSGNVAKADINVYGIVDS